MPQLPVDSGEPVRMTPELWGYEYTTAKPNWVEAALKKIDERFRVRQDRQGFWWVGIEEPAVMVDGVPESRFDELWRCEWHGARREPDRLDIDNAWRVRNFERLVRERHRKNMTNHESIEREAQNLSSAFGKEFAHNFMVRVGTRARYVQGTEFAK